jgi:DNA-binding LacI/PurR family transcriptional regulator
VLHGVEKALSERGINLLFSDIKNLSPGSNFSQTDGIVIMGAGIDTELLNEFKKRPCICILPNLQDIKNLPTINHDDEEIGRIAFDYLKKKGHKEISVLNSICNHSGCTKRVRTFEWLAAEEGIKIKIFEAACSKNSLHNIHIGFDDDCIDHFIQTLKNKTNRSTALFSICDLQTSRLYAELKEAGIEPMRDIDIISCDNEKATLAPLHPKPATIDIRANLIGKKAAEMLLWHIQNFSMILNEPFKMLIMPKLIIP